MNRTGRDSPREQSGTPPTSANGESVETALQLAIDLHGPALLNRPDKLRQQLEAQCPGAGSDIAFLLAALEERVPQALLAITSVTDMQAVEPRLQELLSTRRGINPFAATWAVSTWASALRMDLFGATTSGPTHGATVPRVRPSAAGRSTATNPFGAHGAPPDDQMPVGVKATAPPAPFTVPFGFHPAAKPPAAPAPIAAAAAVVVPVAPRAAPPVTVQREQPVEPPLADVAVTGSVAPIAVAARPAPRAEAVAAAVIAGPTVPDAAPKRFNPWFGAAGVLAAAIVAALSIRLMSTMNGPQPIAPVTPLETASAPSTPVARAAPSILDVVSDPTLVGDGQEHEVFVSIDPARRDVRSVETTFMAGDGRWEPRVRVYDVQPETTRDGRIAVGRIGLRTTTPATATFQYVLTTTDGARSMPFVKQFAFAPVPARPPAIVDVVAPTGIVAGTPFTLTIDFAPGESRISAVERRTLAADRSADAPARVTPVTALASPKSGTLRYPVEAMAAASRTTFAFTLVDRDGMRSEPRTIVVEVSAPKSTSAGAPAEPARNAPAACTRESCGSVVAVRELDRAKNVEVLVRMDDRTIQTIQSQAPLQVGTRVQSVGGRLVPMGSIAAPPPKNAGTRAPARLLPETPPIVDR